MTRQAKPFGPDLRDAMIYDKEVRALAEMAHRIQAEVLVLAPTKAVAIERMTAVGLQAIAKPHYLKVQMGNSVESLRADEYLVDDGSVIVYHHAVNGSPVLRLSPGQAPVVVARWKHDLTKRGMVLIPETASAGGTP